MELGKIKVVFFQWLGWLSVLSGLVILIMINISLLSGYEFSFMDNLYLWLLITLVISVISFFNKKSRPFGLWGLGICVYVGMFSIFIFFLGWMIAPFP